MKYSNSWWGHILPVHPCHSRKKAPGPFRATTGCWLVLSACALITSCSKNEKETPENNPTPTSNAAAIKGIYEGTAVRYYKPGANCICKDQISQYRQADVAEIQITPVNDSMVNIAIVAKNRAFQQVTVGLQKVVQAGAGYAISPPMGRGAHNISNISIAGKNISGIVDMSYGGNDPLCIRACGNDFSVLETLDIIEFNGQQ